MVAHLKGSFVLVLACVLSGGSCSTSDSTGVEAAEPTEAALAGSAEGEATEETPQGVGSNWTSGPQQPLNQAEIQAIKQEIEAARQAYKNGKDLGLSNKFLPNGKLFRPNAAAAVGATAIQAFVKQSPKIDTLTFSNITVDGAGNAADVTVDVAMAGKTNDPANDNALTIPVSSTGTLLIVMKKQGNKWRAKTVSYTPSS